MGKENIFGKVNVPSASASYEGVTTDTATVVVDNAEKTIAVNVNKDSVTQECRNLVNILGREVASIDRELDTKATKEELDVGLSTKVDKEVDKGLSANDFTNVDKDTTSRFEKVYVNDLSQDVIDSLNVHFDDENHTITLSPDELNNYSFKDLYAYVDDYYQTHVETMPDIDLDYNNAKFLRDDFTIDGFLWIIQRGNSSILLDLEYYKFLYSDADFEYDLHLECSEDNYSIVKTTIIKDLLKNLGYKIIVDEETIDEMIHDEKNIISKIVVSGGRMTLPKYILPLRIKTQFNSLYFNYETNKVIDKDGEVYENLNIINNNQVSFPYDSEGLVIGIEYIYFQGTPKILNTYDIYHIPTSGTKLYRHFLTFSNDDCLVIINNMPNDLTWNNLKGTSIFSRSVSMRVSIDSTGDSGIVSKYEVDDKLILTSVGFTANILYTTDFYDEVTEL